MELVDVRGKGQRIYEQILENIKGLLVNGQLGPGDKLLPERQLAEVLNVSRASVREALIVLQTMGVIEVNQSGTYVRAVSLSDLVQPFAVVAMREYREVLELLEVRKTVEVKAAELAATRAEPAEIAGLRDAAERFRADFENASYSDQSDSDFHAWVAAGTQNGVLNEVMTMLNTLYRETYVPIRVRLMAQAGGEFSEDHFHILEAILDRDPEAAARAMARHMDRTIDLCRAIGEDDGQMSIEQR